MGKIRDFESWQVFHVARKKLGANELRRIFTRSTRLVTMWAANPRYCARTARNPLDRIRMLLDALDTAGYGEYGRAAIDYMAEPLGGCFADIHPARSDKGAVDPEIADMAIAVGKLAAQVREALADGNVDTEERIRIKKVARDLRREIEQLLDVIGIA